MLSIFSLRCKGSCTITDEDDSGGGAGKTPRRAWSFKEDFLDILSQMRSPGGGTRPGSPKAPPPPKARTTSTSDQPPHHPPRNPVHDFDRHVKEVQCALKHFKDVVSTNKLEVLPGNGTLVLESITNIHGLLKTYIFIDQSSSLVSATNQVYQSLAQLIKLCDNVLLEGEKAIDEENVAEVLQLVENAVQNLVALAVVKIGEQKNKTSDSTSKPSPLDRSSTYSAELTQRNSLPDIPLTPRERQILEQTTQSVQRTTHNAHHRSSESILLDDTPPPKPPLPGRMWSNESPPPPLPPKQRNSKGPPTYSMEQLSMRSEDTSSIGSLDSMLNASSRDEEIRALMMDEDSSMHTEASHGLSNTFKHAIRSWTVLNGGQNSNSCCCWDSPGSNSNNSNCTSNNNNNISIQDQTQQPTAPVCAGGVERTSSSSGFVSMRSSSQSYNMSSSMSMTTESTAMQLQVVAASSSSSCSSSTMQQTTFQQKTISSRSIAVSSPPALPAKQRSRRERHPSQYDNVPSEQTQSCTTINHAGADGNCTEPAHPPPLPLKKKHMFQSVAYSVMAYMEMFGNCSHASTNEFLRHSVHTYSILRAEWQQQEVKEMTLSSAQSCSFNMVSRSSPSTDSRSVSPGVGYDSEGAAVSDLPPALPPKQRTRHRSTTTSPPPPASPSPIPPSNNSLLVTVSTPEPTNAKDCRDSSVSPQRSPLQRVELSPVVTNGNSPSPALEEDDTKSLPPPDSPLAELDMTRYLIFKKNEEDGPDIRGGHPDALIIHATKASKNDFLYQEAFLTTYRTFLSPLECIEKLCRRHQRFCTSSDVVKQRAAREAFSLLVRVVSELTASDLDVVVLQTLMEFGYQLLCSGDLTMAKALRVKVLEKHTAKQSVCLPSTNLTAQNVYIKQSLLINFKSSQMAEQMTLLDADLFMKIEIPEVLIWAQEQNEDRSPNLTRFTEHFNKMSFWARSRILEQQDAKDRERYVVKFIKIMKHLRKINNFNSYLALLSALDSAPIRRLEWQKQITEGLKEYCALIDSSSSFRAYRQALAETQPPCIPYIGLVLQDLTFVHIGNNDYLTEGVINFSKRWQQFNIVENMKRFKKGIYKFEKNERIIGFFNNFNDCLCEEAMWQISESIKPRGTKK
ncbi:guanine nucleotide-releasing factor 2 isoform X3 [Nilaparvata lugens]|uniref:guanine nucleotide-releasing factor 2 isoform X3 n=1 Tax=Nilaparvata lugens TaxID=108931 RepID=UPI00193D9994|nr:guanine nucleotide-releasing factor 2 isoform X3 [Nilaparvata lugens]